MIMKPNVLSSAKRLVRAWTKPYQQSVCVCAELLDVYLSVKLVVAQVETGVDWLERLEVDVDLLLLAFFCDDGSTVQNQPIRGYCIHV